MSWRGLHQPQRAAPPAQGDPRKVLELPSMLGELVFLSVTVLRPHLANDLTAEPNRINSFWWGVRGRAFALAAGLVVLNMSVSL